MMNMKTPSRCALIIRIAILCALVSAPWCLAQEKAAKTPANFATGVELEGKQYSLEDLVAIARKSLKAEGVVLEEGKSLVILRIFPDDKKKFCSVEFLHGPGKPGYSVAIDKKLVPQKSTRVDVIM